jgi:hypothetical protein
MRWLLDALGIRKRCGHLRVRETMACDAICRDCGQNLGFIQNWRDANKTKAGASEISNDPNDPLSWQPTRTAVTVSANEVTK